MSNGWGWTWPVPGHVPWDFTQVKEWGIPAPPGTPIHAVESGTIVEEGPLTVEGASGFVRYWGVTRARLVFGTRKNVQQGECIGRISSQSVRLELTAHEDPGDKFDSPIDIMPLLRPAWCRVVDRFHRDVPPPLTNPVSIRERIRWLQDHPLWHYPISIPVPPEGVSDDLVEREDGLFEMPDTSDWDRKMERWGGGMHECLDYDFVYVDPTTETRRGPTGREDKDPRNTAFRVWIEGGGWVDQSQDPHIPEPDKGWTEHNKWTSCHDFNLNCGAETMEQALLQLAMRVKFFYTDEGDDREVPTHCGGYFKDDDEEQYVSHCEDAGDGFCKKCGYLIDAPEIDDEEDDNGKPTQP